MPKLELLAKGIRAYDKPAGVWQSLGGGGPSVEDALEGSFSAVHALDAFSSGVTLMMPSRSAGGMPSRDSESRGDVQSAEPEIEVVSREFLAVLVGRLVDPAVVAEPAVQDLSSEVLVKLRIEPEPVEVPRTNLREEKSRAAIRNFLRTRRRSAQGASTFDAGSTTGAICTAAKFTPLAPADSGLSSSPPVSEVVRSAATVVKITVSGGGTTHYLRAAAEHLGHPVLGDPIYNEAKGAPYIKLLREGCESTSTDARGSPTQLLHCSSVTMKVIEPLCAGDDTIAANERVSFHSVSAPPPVALLSKAEQLGVSLD